MLFTSYTATTGIYARLRECILKFKHDINVMVIEQNKHRKKALIIIYSMFLISLIEIWNVFFFRMKKGAVHSVSTLCHCIQFIVSLYPV